MEDAEILKLFMKRDESAIQELFAQYGTLCMTAACNMLGNKEDAEECVNDAMMHLWNAIPPACPESLGAFLMTAVRNAARDRLSYHHAKKRGGRLLAVSVEELADCLPASGHPEQMLDSLALRDAFRRFLPTLSPAARDIFLRRYWLCLSAAEVAALTGCSVARVNVSLMRSRKKLKEFLRKENLL